MSILLSDQDKIYCKNETCIVADLNTKGKKDVNFLCIKCLVEQHSNQKLTLTEDTKKLISQMKFQKMEKQTKENEPRLETFKNNLKYSQQYILIKKNQIFIQDKNKRVVTLDLTFDKMISFVQQRLIYIQKDIESLQFEGKNNYLEDITELSRIYSEEMVDDFKKLQDDNKVIDEIQKQFEVLFSTPQYLQMNQIIKNKKCLINEANEDAIIIQSIKLTNIHWLNSKQNQIIKLMKLKKKLSFQTIYYLNEEDLLEALKTLNKLKKGSALDTKLIEYQTGKNKIFYQDIENKLEQLKQHNILDIQQSKNILNENTYEGNELEQLQEMITQLIQQTQSHQQNKSTLEEINKDLNEFLRNTKQYECHIDQFKNALKFYQEYILKIEPVRNKLVSLKQDKNNCIKLFNKHIQIFKENSVRLEKFSEIDDKNKTLRRRIEQENERIRRQNK